MEWSQRSASPSELIRALALPPYPALMLQRALRRIHEPGPLCVLHDVVLDSHPARLHLAPGAPTTAFHFPGGRAWRMALLPRAHELLTLRSPEPPETHASTVIGLILGALAPGGDLLGPPPPRKTVYRRLATLSAEWYDDWADLGLTPAQKVCIRQVTFRCVAPQLHLPDPVWGPVAVLQMAMYAIDRPGAVGYENGLVRLPAWADPDLPREAARILLFHAFRSPEGTARPSLPGRSAPFPVPAKHV